MALPTTEYVLDDDEESVLYLKEFVDIVNGGNEPILEARMIFGASDKGDATMRDWQWMHGNGRGTSYTPVVASGDRYHFTGGWQVVPANESGDPSEADRGGFYGVIAWSDARDRHWMRRGRDQPVELRQPMVYDADPQPVHRRDVSTRTVQEARTRAFQARQMS